MYDWIAKYQKKFSVGTSSKRYVLFTLYGVRHAIFTFHKQEASDASSSAESLVLTS